MKRSEWLLKLYFQRKALLSRLEQQCFDAWNAGDIALANKTERAFDRVLGKVWEYRDVLRWQHNVEPMEWHP